MNYVIDNENPPSTKLGGDEHGTEPSTMGVPTVQEACVSEYGPRVTGADELTVPGQAQPGLAKLTEPEKDELRRLVQTVEDGFDSAGRALIAIHDRKLFRETHSTFEAFVKHTWEMSRSTAYRLMDHRRVLTVLAPVGDDRLPQNEAQTRELARLKDQPEKLRQAWGRVLTENGRDEITAKKVRVVVDDVAGVPPAAPPKSGNSKKETAAPPAETPLKPEGPLSQSLLQLADSFTGKQSCELDRKQKASETVRTIFNAANAFLAKYPLPAGVDAQDVDEVIRKRLEGWAELLLQPGALIERLRASKKPTMKS